MSQSLYAICIILCGVLKLVHKVVFACPSKYLEKYNLSVLRHNDMLSELAEEVLRSQF